jgi:hypothetical protein
MKRNIYIILSVATLGFLSYTSYYTITHINTPTVAVVATSTPVVATSTPVEDKTLHVTSSGKKIRVTETNPDGESLSTITITTEGFATNTPIVLETNKMTNVLYTDLNNDSQEELIVTTMSAGSGSFGEVFIFTTASSTVLLPVTIPKMTENDTKKGALFEGYMGHDSFTLLGNTLVREFPTYKKEDTNDEPTGPTKRIIYSLVEKNGMYSIVFVQGTSTPAAQTAVSKPSGTSTTAH